ncbi:MAG TPA: GAF domain-containing protein, partial [Gemmatimonadales bacterium]|nr:GAF domain-containing protein [Gemmatimonadales bacterium]
MTKKLHILHLEDDHLDLELVSGALEQAKLSFEINVASTEAEYRQALEVASPDVIIADSSVLGFDALSAMRLARARLGPVPFIVVSGLLNAQQRTRCLAAGANGCVAKSALADLAGTILRCLEEAGPIVPASHWYARAMEKLVAVIQELSLARDLPRIMEIVRRSARELTGADGATFVLRDGEQCHYADEDAIAPLWKGRRFPMTSCISGWAMLNRQAAVIEDIYADPRIPAEAYRPTFVKSLVMVPIRTADPVGAIGNYWAARRKPRPEEVKLLQALADSTSVAMENVQLYAGLERKV